MNYDTTILPPSRNHGRIPAPSREARMAVSHVLVVVVSTTGTCTTRRRVFLSLKSAERAVTRAHMKAQDAQIVLARLIPEPGTSTWDEAVSDG